MMISLASIEEEGRIQDMLRGEILVPPGLCLPVGGQDDMVQLCGNLHPCLFAARAEGELALAGHLVHLGHLGHGDIVGVDAHHSVPFLVHVQHDLRRLCRRLVENRDDDLHDEIHGRVVVVVQEHAIQLRLLETRLLLYTDILLEDAGGISRGGHVCCSFLI